MTNFGHFERPIIHFGSPTGYTKPESEPNILIASGPLPPSMWYTDEAT